MENNMHNNYGNRDRKIGLKLIKEFVVCKSLHKQHNSQGKSRPTVANIKKF